MFCCTCFAACGREGAQFIGEELVLAAWEAPRAVELFVEKSMIDDLCDEDHM